MMSDSLLGRHISLPQNYEDFYGFNPISKVFAQVVDLYDTAICDAILDFAKRESVTDVYLLDKEFVKTALINEAKRRKFGEVKELNNLDKYHV